LDKGKTMKTTTHSAHTTSELEVPDRLQVIGARDPVWVDAEHTAIDLKVTFNLLGEVAFTASPKDPEAYGRQVFKDAKAGRYGKVKPPSPAFLQAQAEAKLEILMEEATVEIERLERQMAAFEDAEARGLLTELGHERRVVVERRLEEWRRYRVLLGLVSDNEILPGLTNWPKSPSA
jgi:hypothetical protein